MELTPEKLDEILEEIAGYEVSLVEDPTLPEHGTRYLQKCVSDCRNYTNRVQHYLQICKKAEKVLRREISIAETDLDLKFKNLLSEDPMVRRESSYGDRQARATSILKEEFEHVASLKVRVQDLDETIKILKMKYGDLKATNSDIKLQRQIIRDEMSLSPDPTNNGKGRTYGSGMSPPVDRQIIDPVDLFDDAKRPEDLPKPKDMAHAKQIANFYNNAVSVNANPKEEVFETPPIEEPEESEKDKTVSGGVSYSDLLS